MGIAWWGQRTLTFFAAAALGACQLVAGLGDLEPSAAGSGGATSSSGPGPGGGDGGEGGGGEGGGGMGGGGGCADPCGVAVVRTETDTGPIRHLAVDETHVYFGENSIWRAPLTPGSEKQPLVPPQPQAIRGMALDDLNGYVLWTRDEAGVFRIPRNGNGVPVDFDSFQSELMGPVAARAGQAYWIVGPSGGSPGSPTGNGVHCADVLAGTTGVDTWVGGSPRWPAATVAVAQVGVTQTAYYHRFDTIWRREGCPQPGNEGKFAIYSMDDATAFGLATDDQSLYWTHRRGDGAVYRKALSDTDGQNGEVFAGAQSFPGHLTTAKGYVYWSTTSLGCDEPTAAIHRKPADGSGEAELLQSGLICPSAFAVDPEGQFIYWADQGTIYRLPLGS